ncbi:MAG TPA: S-layer protein domain-containing protein [Methanothrix sp.]|nr:S-layer protein domain-containing protein [Methanothrix sp.]
MKGDFSRFTHKPEKHYTSVLKQQGRVDLDADWNEQACIQAYLNEEGSKDILGPSGIPSQQAGFGISKASIGENGIDFSIGQGRIYVDGILCQLEGKEASYLKQPYYVNPEMIKAPGAGRRDLIYLDVWKRHVTAVEDDSLREIALGGPDTTTRLKTIWQVKALADVSKANPCNIAEWKNLISPTSGWSKLSVKLDASKPEEKPCAADLEAGYRGRENRLYRVEIHNGGIIKAGSAASGSNPTFKWSRDNGSVLFPIYELDKQNKRKLKLRRLGKDQFLNLHKGDWVEVLDDSRELAGEPGIMAEVTEDIDEEQLIVTLSKEISDIDINNGHAKLRRWDQKEDAIRIIPESLIDLEAGLQISFLNGKFRTGDYWVFAARSNGDVELLDSLPPMGIEHHYCILALVTWMMVSGKLKAVVLDCRKTFPPLTDLICLYYIGGDGQEAMPGQPLKQPLQVGVSNGSRPIKGAQASGMNVEFKITDDDGDGDDGSRLSDSTEFASGSNSKAIPVDKDGIAKCFWRLGKEPISQKVEARLIDACGKYVHLPIRFSANLSIASEVAYDEPRCGHMNAENVRDALNTLCQNYGLYYVGGDGQEGFPRSILDQPLQVRVSNGIWPEAGATVNFEVESGGGQLSDNNATTNADGIAGVKWTLGGSGIQRIKASLSNAPTMTIFFNAGLKAIGGPSCQIPVGGQSAYRELADALNDLINVKGMSDVCLCLLPGNYSFPEGDWTLNSPNARVKIVGSGLGSIIDLKKTTMLMKGLASISLKDLKIDAGNLNRDGLILEDCGQIDIESCHLTGDAAAAKPCIGLQKTLPFSRGVDISLMPGVNIKRAGSDDLRFCVYKLIDQPGVYKIRGAVAGIVNGKSNLTKNTFTWDHQNFAGFFYDIYEDIGTERLIANINENKKLSIEYETRVHNKKFRFEDWGSFSVIGFLGEEYFAGYMDAPNTTDDILFEESKEKNLFSKMQLLRILIDNDDEMTITSGTPLRLEEGYELGIKSIDIDGNKVFLELSKDGAVVDSKVISPSKDGATMKDRTYYYKKNIGDFKDVVIIAAHFKNAFRGTDQDLATVDGLWHLSDTLTDVSKDTEYDKMKIQKVTQEAILMSNMDNDITLNRNKDISLMPGVSLKTADDDVLRFYVYKHIEITNDENYQIRGAIAGTLNGKSNLESNSFAWNPQNFAGFFYDINADVGTEMLTAKINEDNKISVKYETCIDAKKFEVGNWGSYSTIGFLAEEYFAGYLNTPETADDIPFEESDDENVLADGQLLKILIDNDDEMTIASGTPHKLEEGYELGIKSIDIDGNKVFLELSKDGAVVDSKVISPSKDGATMLDKTYYYKKDIGDSRDVVIIAAHFKNAFRGADQDLATIDGQWQLSDIPADLSEYGMMGAEKANGAILKISNAGRIHIENNDIHVKSPSVIAKPQLIIDKRAFPEFGDVVMEKGSENFDSTALKFAENLRSKGTRERKELQSRLEKAIKPYKTSMKRADLQRYNLLIDATTKDEIPPKMVADALRDIIAYEVGEISLASALAILDARADTAIERNRIEGMVSFYGIPTSQELNQNDLEGITGKIKEHTGPGKLLYLRGNRIGRFVIGDDMKEIIKSGINIGGLYKSSFFSENLIKNANNQIVSDHLSFCSNVFEDDKYDAGTAISNSAIFMGNYSQYEIKFISLSNHLSKDAGNLIMQIGP